MGNNLCKSCRSEIFYEPFEMVASFERECRAIMYSARLGCCFCAMLQTDLSLLGSERVAKVFLTLQKAFLNPKNDSWGLVLGLNRTPLRYLMHPPEDIEPLLDEGYQTTGDTRSKASFDRARTWLETCKNEHDHCASIDSNFRPTRLLRVDKGGESVSLCSGSSLQPGTQYATLSHCWGGSVPGQLKTHNIKALESSIPPEFLGKTFRDAAEIALELGLCFIWIDSLCIIQDSPKDWQSESVKMSQIYGNSSCNIAATSASNTFGGCFSSRRLADLKVVKLDPFGSWFIILRLLLIYVLEYMGKPVAHRLGSFYVTNVTQWWDRFQEEPLNRRAWIVQERVLSPRNIHYTQGQLVWECNDLLASEAFPHGFGDLLISQTRPVRVPLDSAMRNAQEEDVPGQALAQIWRPVVNLFTATGITKPTDRLIALYGVGSRIQQVCGWPYVAGMFMKNLQSQLCWTVTGDVKSTRPEIPIAPTWSWASVSNQVDMMPQWEIVERDETGEGPKAKDLDEHYLCDILGIEPGTSAAEKSGHVSSALLRVNCHLVPATILMPQGAPWECSKGMAVLHFNSMQGGECDRDSKSDDENSAVDASSRNPPVAYIAVAITWDNFSDNKPHEARNLMFMPVYQMIQYGHWQPSISYTRSKTMHGLILQASDLVNGDCTFRRCGTFAIEEKGIEDFWALIFRYRMEAPKVGSPSPHNGISWLGYGVEGNVELAKRERTPQCQILIS